MLGGALVLAASLTQSAPADVVRVHFESGKRTNVALWARRGADPQYSLVCTSPCTADIPTGTPLRVVFVDHEDEPYDFTLSNDKGHEIDLNVRRGGRGALAGGIVMTSVGALTALVGVVLAAVSLAEFRGQASFRTAGFICIGVGGGLTVGGILLISGRTYEPVVKQRPFENSRFASVPLPAITTPFSLTFAF